MAINGIIGPGGSLFGQAVQNLNTQLTNLSTELATQKKSTTYSGFGVNEGFAIAARSQLSDISAFTTTITNVNTVIDSANTALQSFSKIAGQVQSGAASGAQNINSTGQTIAQQNGLGQLTGLVGILNTQVGDRFIFSGSAIHTPSVTSADTILNGTSTQAGLKQVIAERAQADGTTGLGRLVITPPATTGAPPATTTAFSIAEDVAGSPFGLKLNSVSSTLTGATVSGPSGSPPAISISLGATNPNPGEKVSITFNLPDGTTDSVQLTASSASPLPSGTFAIGTTTAATAANLNAALNTAIGTLANTSLVAASAVEAGHDFFDPAGTATGSEALNQGAPAATPPVPPVPITAATALSGAAANSLKNGFANGDTLTVNGKTITFSNAPNSLTGPPFNINPATSTVGNLLTAIDSITGTSTPSTIDGGVITFHTDNPANFSVTSSNPNALLSLGFAPNGTPAQPIVGSAVLNQGVPAGPGPAAISGTTLLSGATPNAIISGFTPGDTITINGQAITFVASGATGNQLNVTDNVQTLLSKIDSITGTTIASTVNSTGTITLNNANGNLSVTSSNLSAFAALGLAPNATPTQPITGNSVLVKGAPAPTLPVAISGTTLLSGVNANAITSPFAPGDTITINGKPITFSNAPNSLAGPTFNINLAAGTVQNLLAAIDSITGTTTASTVSATGAITLNITSGSLSVTSSNPDALAALGLGSTVTPTQPPFRVSGSPLSSATSLVNGSADTVAWYTGNSSSSPRTSSTARIDSNIVVPYGAQANEQAIRTQLEGVAVFAAVTVSPTAANSSTTIAALSQRIATNLTPQPGQQTIADIQTDFANTQNTIKEATDRQTQTQTLLQNIVDQTETASTQEVASQILALQTTLQASYETTSILAGLTLTKFLVPGG